MTRGRLLADIGGTNARFAAWTGAGEITRFRQYAVAGFATFADALEAWRAEAGAGIMPDEAAIAGAGPVADGEIKLTNAPWRISRAAIGSAIGGGRVRLFNDLEAVAHALPYLGPSDITQVGPRAIGPASGRRLAVNVGTGFGAAVCMPASTGGWMTCPSEAGHMTAGFPDAIEAAVLDGFGPRPLTVEDVLSGAGMVALHRHLAGADAPARPNAKAVFEAAPDDAAARQAVDIFTVWLGRAAGNLALATASWNGVYLSGGLVRSWAALGDAAAFRAAFEAKGKMTDRMRTVPTAVVTHAQVALLGLAHAPLD